MHFRVCLHRHLKGRSVSYMNSNSVGLAVQLCGAHTDHSGCMAASAAYTGTFTLLQTMDEVVL